MESFNILVFAFFTQLDDVLPTGFLEFEVETIILKLNQLEMLDTNRTFLVHIIIVLVIDQTLKGGSFIDLLGQEIFTERLDHGSTSCHEFTIHLNIFSFLHSEIADHFTTLVLQFLHVVL